MRAGWLGFELGVVLDSDKPRMIGHFHDFHQRIILAGPRDNHAVGFQLLTVSIIEFPAMAMAFADFGRIIALHRLGAGFYLCSLSSQPHRATFVDDILLFVHQSNYRMC